MITVAAIAMPTPSEGCLGVTGFAGLVTGTGAAGAALAASASTGALSAAEAAGGGTTSMTGVGFGTAGLGSLTGLSSIFSVIVAWKHKPLEAKLLALLANHPLLHQIVKYLIQSLIGQFSHELIG